MMFVQSGVKHVKTLLRSVSAVQSSISEQIVASARPRSFKVCTSSRRRRRGLEASSLDELLEQAARVFVLSCHFLILVLEEDGTVVDSEEFFQSLPSNAALMVLEKGEMWTQNRVLPGSRQSKRNGIAKLTFDLYKLHPQDFLCCFAVKATLHEVYVLSYDFRWSRMKHVLNWLLCCLTCLIRLTGQMLLQTSSSLLQLCGDDDC